MNALSIAIDCREWLANSLHPRILHVFGHACNLINERREVLSLVTQQIGNGPFNLVVEEDICFSEHVNIESPISVPGNQITLGDLVINTTRAKLWCACPDWEVLHAKRGNILNQLKKLLITNYQVRGLDTGFAHLPWYGSPALAGGARVSRTVPGTTAQPYSTTVFHPKLPITNYQFSDALIFAVTNADFPSSLTSASKLAGLGAGLTPAGDDFIMGAIYAASIIHPPEIARVLAEEITDLTAPLTTSLSAAWLRSAGRGEAGILWHKFFEALSSADPMHIQEAMDKILAVGETSGADAMTGFTSLLIYWGEYCSNL